MTNSVSTAANTNGAARPHNPSKEDTMSTQLNIHQVVRIEIGTPDQLDTGAWYQQVLVHREGEGVQFSFFLTDPTVALDVVDPEVAACYGVHQFLHEVTELEIDTPVVTPETGHAVQHITGTSGRGLSKQSFGITLFYTKGAFPHGCPDCGSFEFNPNCDACIDAKVQEEMRTTGDPDIADMYRRSECPECDKVVCDCIRSDGEPDEHNTTREDRIRTYTMTARDWQLYSSHAQSDYAAHRFNTVLRECMDARKTVAETQDAMYEVMDLWVHTGARDTEPECVLCDVLELLYNLPDGSVDR
jgi:hypothetical protein